jgi:hypothetical protein
MDDYQLDADEQILLMTYRLLVSSYAEDVLKRTASPQELRDDLSENLRERFNHGELITFFTTIMVNDIFADATTTGNEN